MKKACFVLILMVLWLSPAWAHKVNIFAWVEGDTVYTESKFSGGKKVRHGKVFVYDEKGNLLLEGVTNEQGEFSFKIPGKTALSIELDATMGHANAWRISREEIQEALGETPEPEEPVQEEQTAANTQGESADNTVMTPPERVPQPAAVPGITLADIEKTVEKALDSRLKPINRMLVESTDHKPTINDILGGIGYILGLAGVGAYFHYRSRIKKIDNA